MNTNYRERLRSKNMNELLNSFHRLPVINVICNILLILSFILFTVISPYGESIFPIIWFFGGAIFALIVSNYFPNNGRILIAQEIESRSSRNLNTNNVFSYVIESERNLFGNYRYNSFEEFCYKLNKVLKVIALIVYIFYVGMLIILSAMIGVMIVVVTFFISLVVRTVTFHRIMHTAFVPTVFLFNLFVNSYGRTTRNVFANINAGSVRSEGTTTDPNEMGPGLSQLMLKNCIHLGYYPLHNDMSWVRSLNLSVDMGDIDITGEVLYRTLSSTGEMDARSLVDSLERNIQSDIERQVQDYYRTYPNAPRNVRVNISIDYSVEYIHY